MWSDVLKCLALNNFCSTYRLNVRNLFHEMERFAFIAKLWSGGISMGRAIPLNKSCLSFLGKALSSSSRFTPSVSRKFCTCCTRRWTVREQASEVATLLVDTGIRLMGYVVMQKGRMYPVFYIEHPLPIPHLPSCWNSHNSVLALRHQPPYQMLSYLFTGRVGAVVGLWRMCWAVTREGEETS